LGQIHATAATTAITDATANAVEAQQLNKLVQPHK
jgi:hypothetical protein